MMITWNKLLALCTLFFIMMISTQTWAGFVRYSVDDLGGGIFRYDLSINNFMKFNIGEPISGLNILHANSVFGLDDFSVIDVPIDWSFFAPFPPFLDELNYFSLNPNADVLIGASQSGYSFQSMTDPATLSGNDFLVEVILTSGVQGPQEVAQIQIPEPYMFALMTIGLIGVANAKHRRTFEPFSKLR